jgi:hypothetical protein
MAIISPPLHAIASMRPKPTEGEWVLLNFLHTTLDDTYEVFFQPFLNGDMPDVVIMRRGSGVYIIEVKDWDLDLYSIDNRRSWYVSTNSDKNIKVVSPIDQVFKYKQNLFNLHIEGLLEKRIKNPKLMSMVNCGVYFHKATTSKCNGFVIQNGDGKEITEKHRKFLTYFDFLGKDSLSPDSFFKIMTTRWMNRPSRLFDDDLYKSFKRHLLPPTHTLEQGIEIVYSDEQKKVIESSQSGRQKVKGVAGSGKTLCLAKRAVNAHLRHGESILILTFNISLRNYIHDKISEVKANFEWRHFHIIHYHEFFKNQANKHNLPVQSRDDWYNVIFFDRVRDRIKAYQTIIIDEIQDYEEQWIELIKNTFLDKQKGEYVVFGDEKQNIYQRNYDHKERKPYTGIGGNWNLLKRSYRITNDIARIAQSFQSTFFLKKYELDEILIQRSLFERSELKYVYISDTTYNIDAYVDLYRKFVRDLSIHENDVCFQCATVDLLRSLDQNIRLSSSQKTNTMFETQEMFDFLVVKYELIDKIPQALNLIKALKKGILITSDETELVKRYVAFKKEIELIRRNKKFNYWNNKGYLKLSTVHSFKGWEVNTMFLIIKEEQHPSDYEDFTTEEILYTAITRCRQNLIIINNGNSIYHEFFQNNMLMK